MTEIHQIQAARSELARVDDRVMPATPRTYTITLDGPLASKDDAALQSLLDQLAERQDRATAELTRWRALGDSPEAVSEMIENVDRLRKSRRTWIEAATVVLGEDWSGSPEDLRLALKDYFDSFKARITELDGMLSVERDASGDLRARIAELEASAESWEERAAASELELSELKERLAESLCMPIAHADSLIAEVQRVHGLVAETLTLRTKVADLETALALTRSQLDAARKGDEQLEAARVRPNALRKPVTLTDSEAEYAMRYGGSFCRDAAGQVCRYSGKHWEVWHEETEEWTRYSSSANKGAGPWTIVKDPSKRAKVAP